MIVDLFDLQTVLHESRSWYIPSFIWVYPSSIAVTEMNRNYTLHSLTNFHIENIVWSILFPLNQFTSHFILYYVHLGRYNTHNVKAFKILFSTLSPESVYHQLTPYNRLYWNTFYFRRHSYRVPIFISKEVVYCAQRCIQSFDAAERGGIGNPM